MTDSKPTQAQGTANKGGQLAFKKYELGRVYLDVLVTPTIGAWVARCNGRRFTIKGNCRADIINGARSAAVRAFNDYYWTTGIKPSDVRLEHGDTSWEYVASVDDAAATAKQARPNQQEKSQ